MGQLEKNGARSLKLTGIDADAMDLPVTLQRMVMNSCWAFLSAVMLPVQGCRIVDS